MATLFFDLLIAALRNQQNTPCNIEAESKKIGPLHEPSIMCRISTFVVVWVCRRSGRFSTLHTCHLYRVGHLYRVACGHTSIVCCGVPGFAPLPSDVN